jgi:hypothetical protein
MLDVQLTCCGDACLSWTVDEIAAGGTKFWIFLWANVISNDD